MTDLIGAELDAAVARALGWRYFECESNIPTIDGKGIKNLHRWWVEDCNGMVDQWVRNFDGEEGFSPSQCWEDGGPIIERERIDLMYGFVPRNWKAIIGEGPLAVKAYGPTPLIAAMRAFVASKA